MQNSINFKLVVSAAIINQEEKICCLDLCCNSGLACLVWFGLGHGLGLALFKTWGLLRAKYDTYKQTFLKHYYFCKVVDLKICLKEQLNVWFCINTTFGPVYCFKSISGLGRVQACFFGFVSGLGLI